MTAHGQALVIAILAGVLSTACLGRSPTTEYYSLRALSASGVSSSAQGSQGPAVRVGPAQMPRFLDQPQIARRTGDNTLAYDEFHRWAGSLQSELLRVVGANLATLLQSDRVVVYPGVAPFRLDYRIVLDVERFEAGPGSEVTLRTRWAILPGGAGDALLTGISGSTESASSDGAADLVAAHSVAADQLSRALAARIRELSGQAAVP